MSDTHSCANHRRTLTKLTSSGRPTDEHLKTLLDANAASCIIKGIMRYETNVKIVTQGWRCVPHGPLPLSLFAYHADSCAKRVSPAAAANPARFFIPLARTPDSLTARARNSCQFFIPGSVILHFAQCHDKFRVALMEEHELLSAIRQQLQTYSSVKSTEAAAIRKILPKYDFASPGAIAGWLL